MLAEWADRTTEPTGRQLRAFVQASALRWRCQWTARQIGSARAQRLGPGDAGAAGRGSREAFGTPALVAVRPLLSSEALLARPLFATELSLFEGNREMARWFFDRIGPNGFRLRRRPTGWPCCIASKRMPTCSNG